MDKVLVLLSSFNGSKYIEEQIKSLEKQSFVRVTVLIRDDGSSDDTKEIINKITKEKRNFICFFENNIGVKESFLRLLRIASSLGEWDYYAFCDQDDVWMHDKLFSAVDSLKKNKAELYYSSYTTVVHNLGVLQENVQHHSPDKLGVSLVNLAVTGCTMVFTKNLMRKSILYMPNKIMMHDSWLYKIALALEYKVVYDPVAHIYYRQHANNVIGDHNSIVKKWRNRYRRWFCDVTNDRYYEAEELYKGYSPIMSQTQLSILSPVICYRDKSFLQRLKIAFNPAYKTGKVIVDISFKLSILAKKY